MCIDNFDKGQNATLKLNVMAMTLSWKHKVRVCSQYIFASGFPAERERGVHAMRDIFPIIRRGTAEPRRETAATAKTLLQTSSY